MIEEVEELCAELDIQPFHDRCPLEHREVEIDYALLTKRSIHARLIAKSPGIVGRTNVAVVSAGRCEAGGIEPSIHSG